MSINKLALNAITTPDRTAYQQWLLDAAAEITNMFEKRPTRDTVMQWLIVRAMTDGLPEEITATPKGVGNVVNSIIDIAAYVNGGGTIVQG